MQCNGIGKVTLATIFLPSGSNHLYSVQYSVQRVHCRAASRHYAVVVVVVWPLVSVPMS